jgi:uncharacterized membrane protein
MARHALTTASVAIALAGAVTLLSVTTNDANAAAREKCYGIAKSGENACANAAGKHSCAGNATVSFDGEDYKKVSKGTCTTIGGNLKPFKGINPKMKG